jgi:hypothetical protein
MLKLNLIILSVLLSTLCSYAQNEEWNAEDTLIYRVQELDEVKIPRNYKSAYRSALRRVQKVYPLALHAAHIVDSLETELEKLDKKRQQKKLTRDTHKELKADFKFLLKELYVQEGIVLSKLIHRETGMTVREIIEKYRGSAQASLYSGMASLFDQELDAIYDPDGEDFIIECVIRDIEAGKVKFDNKFEIVDRAHYRADRKEYKKRVRENRKAKKSE